MLFFICYLKYRQAIDNMKYLEIYEVNLEDLNYYGAVWGHHFNQDPRSKYLIIKRGDFCNEKFQIRKVKIST